MRILTQVAITVQPRAKGRKPGKRIQIIFLKEFTIEIRRLATGEQIILFEPP
jgi:hypothetical protein